MVFLFQIRFCGTIVEHACVNHIILQNKRSSRSLVRHNVGQATVDKVGCAAAVIGIGKVMTLVDIARCITAASALDRSLTLKVAITR